jgi:hypothetical protein
MRCRLNLALRCGVAAIAALFVISAAPANAQIGGGFIRQPAIGGISVNVEGVVAQSDPTAAARLRQERLAQLQPMAAELGEGVQMRKISLRGLESAIEEVLANGGPVPDAIAFLAGLQRIEYVFVYPEKQDIVLAGPGEGWKVNEKGEIVGVSSGRPVIHLDDLLTAFRSVDAARQGGITCSIDPTPEGVRRLNAFMARQRGFTPAVLAGAQEALGPQTITITGVSPESHFARVLVAADVHMKRIAMKLDPSPVPGLVSYLDLIRTAPTSLMPRWWLACHYDPVAKSEDGLAWQIRGVGVRCFTEDEAVGADGRFRSTGRVDASAQKWADMMSDNYEKLMDREASFAQLRNLMDLSVAAALIQREGLLSKSGCDLPLILGAKSELETTSLPAPRSIPTQCSFIRRGRETIITASGGVEVNSWEAASNVQAAPALQGVREKALANGKQWFWN